MDLRCRKRRRWKSSRACVPFGLASSSWLIDSGKIYESIRIVCHWCVLTACVKGMCRRQVLSRTWNVVSHLYIGPAGQARRCGKQSVNLGQSQRLSGGQNTPRPLARQLQLCTACCVLLRKNVLRRPAAIRKQHVFVDWIDNPGQSNWNITTNSKPRLGNIEGMCERELLTTPHPPPPLLPSIRPYVGYITPRCGSRTA